MGTILSIAGHQGGAGKTTTAMNLGISLARQGHKVLLVDTDPLGAMTPAAGLPDADQPGLVQLLRGTPQAEAIVASRLDIPLALLASGVKQPADAFFLEHQAKRGRLQRLIQQVAADYDFVLLDTPSSIEAISAMAFASSHSLLLVLPAHTSTVKTLPGLLRLLVRIQDKLNPDLHLLGILASHVDSQNPYELDTLAAMRTAFAEGLFFSTIIPRSRQFERAASGGTALTLLADSSGVGALYDHLAQEVLRRLAAITSAGNDHAQPEKLF